MDVFRMSFKGDAKMDGIELYNENCFDVIGRLEDRSVDMLLTDPPYLIDVHDGGKMYASKRIQGSIDSLEESGIDKSYDIFAFADLIRPKFRDGVNAYFWCNKRQIFDYLKCWVDGQGCKFEILKWRKTNAIPNYSNKYVTDTEYCLYFFNGPGHCRPASYEDASTYFDGAINQVDKRKYGHPTIKPLEFTERMVRNSSRPGDVVFDPFMGSGTTGVACRLNGRKFIGVEMNAEYFETARGRILDEAGEYIL